ncbi:MAG: hypothetical protein ABI721_05690 [Candidatus Dojkabacteria bacterium]
MIKLSELGDIRFRLPRLKGRKSEILSKLLLSLGVASLFILITILPSSILFTGQTIEQSGFSILVLFTTLTFGFLLSFIILLGKKVFFDPKYFLSVLSFALLTTATSVIRRYTDAHISNTFGIDTFRSLAGFTIMAFVGFYYFINFVIRDMTLMRRFFKFLMLGFSLFVVVLMIHTNISDTSYVNNNIGIVILIYIILLLSIFLTKSKKVLKAALLIVSAIFVFLTPQTSPDPIRSTQVITVLIISIILQGLIYAFFKREIIKTKTLELRNFNSNFKDQKYSISEVSYFLLITVSVLAIVLGILVHFGFNFNFSIITNPINNFVNELKIPFTGSLDFKALLIGSGAYDLALKRTNLDPNVSTIVNIFITQGVVGTLAYLFILITGLIALVKSIRRSLKLKNNRALIFIHSFIMLFTSVYALISYGGVFEAILWWVSFSLFAVYLKLDDLKKIYLLDNWNVEPFIFKKSAGIYFRITFALLVIVLTLFVLYSLSMLKF